MKTSLLILFVTLSASAIAHEPVIIDPHDTAATPFPGHLTYLLSDHTATPGKAAILKLELPARTFGAPPHIHSKEDEHFYVIDGQVEFLDRQQTITAGPGSLVVLPRGHLHGFWNLGDQPATLLLVVTPGEFASFFDQVVAQIRKDHPDNPQAVGAIIGAVAARYDVTVHPDKVPPSALPVLPR